MSNVFFSWAILFEYRREQGKAHSFICFVCKQVSFLSLLRNGSQISRQSFEIKSLYSVFIVQFSRNPMNTTRPYAISALLLAHRRL
ncbi:Uncharacterized protein APZ42_023252 [Daphnia magna]|uniref:Uncharacterized protein n=1 Tax=Daphnia magna TaxID=35525 RepID=A0A0P5VGT5_9CRUS|nr:Uncharacterized protein APZ42_023252 [Daphnia magna]